MLWLIHHPHPHPHPPQIPMARSRSLSATVVVTNRKPRQVVVSEPNSNEPKKAGKCEQ